ncbi:acyl-CoA thioesterase [Atopobacter sp. AH10]|uniref:acyl-CoA thioesterase n=1 Tax=Atopobacter sp. AH10 TaxID=2315861 RepID=UPI000EF1A7AC|nr:acyl-CoA thioesterase [Atopobacter sp. AH10]RLK62664.1 acyl-CoA thioesterase [Atopobacter sp. AH10]
MTYQEYPTGKACRLSRVYQTHNIFPSDCNMHGSLFGGRLLEYIDNAASISVSRHARLLCVTASIDAVNFIAPLYHTNSACVETFISGTGKTSLEVFCKVLGEKLETGERYLAATAFLTFVVVGEAGKELFVPPVYPESDEERLVCEGYEERRKARLAKREAEKAFQKQLSIDLPWS